jgi:hypothetical protein
MSFSVRPFHFHSRTLRLCSRTFSENRIGQGGSGMPAGGKCLHRSGYAAQPLSLGLKIYKFLDYFFLVVTEAR